MAGEVDFDWNEDSEPRVIRSGVLEQQGVVLFGKSMPGPRQQLGGRFRITSDVIDVKTLFWHFIIPARLVSKVTYYRDLEFYGMQVHHLGAEAVPSLFVLGSLDRDLLAQNLGELGYRVLDESSGLYRSAHSD